MSRPWLGHLLTYVSTVYGIGKKIKQARDGKKKPQVLPSTVFCVMLLGFLFRMESFNQLNGWLHAGRFRKLLKGVRLPFIDAIRESLGTYDLAVLQQTHREIIQQARRNHVLRQGTIGGRVVVGLDGVELFESTKKCCAHCLTREIDGVTHYFHRAVACMTIGSDPHLVVGFESLHPKTDRSEKDEGELTGAKRLLKRLHREYHHFADVVVGDAFYANAPFIETVLASGMDAVVRIKDKRMHIVKDAMGLFQKRAADAQWGREDAEPQANRKKRRARRVEVQAWDKEGFEMTGLKTTVRFLRFVETVRETAYEGGQPKQQTATKEAWVVTTLGQHVPASDIWEMIHKRWDIENNGFRELKTKWHIDHCFMHQERAIEAILHFIVIAFNLFQLFLFRRVQGFRELRLTQTMMVEEMRIQAVTAETPLLWLLE
ncbi:transposase [Paenibacillaceae bacterium WGS1546]|uniref:transposase n=1 Tax=Cohnella sp. WGS1546 TaxID=3366810 RepID=UPI00372D4392